MVYIMPEGLNSQANRNCDLENLGEGGQGTKRIEQNVFPTNRYGSNIEQKSGQFLNTEERADGG